MIISHICKKIKKKIHLSTQNKFKLTMILPIYTYGQPVLRKSCEDIDPQTYPELKTLIENMYETMKKSEGVGLAAPQIGKAIRLVVIGLDDLKESYPEYEGFLHAFINPQIIEYDENEVSSMEEGCLSLLGGPRPCKRYKTIKVQWQTAEFQTRIKTFTGWPAQIIQHEIDHCNGILI